MSLGVKQLYQVTKDMSTLKKEVISQIQNDQPANSQKEEKKSQSPEVTKKEFENLVRERLEIAYEDEKQKSALILRCSRIYHEFLCKQDRLLYEHLMQM